MMGNLLQSFFNYSEEYSQYMADNYFNTSLNNQNHENNELITKPSQSSNNQNLINSNNNPIHEPIKITKKCKKKALLIGINYFDTDYSLKGCINDTIKISHLLQKRKFDEIQLVNDKEGIKPTKENFIKLFVEFLQSGTDDDLLFVHFSGHGSNLKDKNNDELDGRDECIITCEMNYILDDELKNIIDENLKPTCKLVCLIDCCHSGTMLDLKYNYLDSNNYDNYSENSKVSECQGNVIMISGCMDTQTSAEALIENKSQGAMTWSFIDSINKTPDCSWRELLKSMRDLLKTGGYEQVPQLSTDSFYDIDSKLFI